MSQLKALKLTSAVQVRASADLVVSTLCEAREMDLISGFAVGADAPRAPVPRIVAFAAHHAAVPNLATLSNVARSW